MDVETIKNALAKLNDHQRSRLNMMFKGRKIIKLFVDCHLTYTLVTVTFNEQESVHWVVLGPKGRVISHKIG